MIQEDELIKYSDVDLNRMLSSLTETVESCMTQIALIDWEIKRRGTKASGKLRFQVSDEMGSEPQ
ncbi:MAG: hypothetical protein EAX87_09385 [Candidatus Thorarchaeota archaeon]|nr:hypothetical protein [Candidatus Thorarchaeota archaeon]